MKQEFDGMIGTEWQPTSVLSDFYDDSSKGAGHVIRECRSWLRNYEGVGRFYYDAIFYQVYFECDEDRAMFLLRWS